MNESVEDASSGYLWKRLIRAEAALQPLAAEVIRLTGLLEDARRDADVRLDRRNEAAAEVTRLHRVIDGDNLRIKDQNAEIERLSKMVMQKEELAQSYRRDRDRWLNAASEKGVQEMRKEIARLEEESGKPLFPVYSEKNEHLEKELKVRTAERDRWRGWAEERRDEIERLEKELKAAQIDGQTLERQRTEIEKLADDLNARTKERDDLERRRQWSHGANRYALDGELDRLRKHLGECAGVLRDRDDEIAKLKYRVANRDTTIAELSDEAQCRGKLIGSQGEEILTLKEAARLRQMPTVVEFAEIERFKRERDEARKLLKASLQGRETLESMIQQRGDEIARLRDEVTQMPTLADVAEIKRQLAEQEKLRTQLDAACKEEKRLAYLLKSTHEELRHLRARMTELRLVVTRPLGPAPWDSDADVEIVPLLP